MSYVSSNGPKTSTVSLTKPSEGGPTPTRSSANAQMEDISDFLLGINQNPEESLLLNKKMISKGKSNLCNKNSLTIKSSPKSVADSTSNIKNFSHFYNESSTEMFQKLWLPPNTNSLASASIFLPGCHPSSTVNYSLYQATNIEPMNKKYLKTCYQSLHSLLPNTTESEDTTSTKKCSGTKQTEDGVITRCRKIRIFPNEEYIKYFNQCFGATRYIYNKTIDAFKKEVEKEQLKNQELAKKGGCVKMIIEKKQGSKTASVKSKRCCKRVDGLYFCKQHAKCKLKYDIKCGFIHWRDRIVKKEKFLSADEKWLSDIPYDTRQLVVKNAMGGVKAAFTNLKRGNINQFEMNFKRKGIDSDYFYVDHRTLKKNLVLFSSKFTKPLSVQKRDFKWLREYLKGKVSDMIISREKPGTYFLQVPYDIKIGDQKIKNSVVSVDPGVITLGTFYDPSGKCGKMGDGLGRKIFDSYIVRVDKLSSCISNEVNNLKHLKQSPKKLKRFAYDKIVKEKKYRAGRRIKKLTAILEVEQSKMKELLKNNDSVKENLSPNLKTDKVSVKRILRNNYFIKKSKRLPKNEEVKRLMENNTLIEKLEKRLENLRRQISIQKLLIEKLSNLTFLNENYVKIKDSYYLNKSKKRIKKLKKRIRLVRKKKSNITKEAHQKAIKFYTDNYKYIVIPEFDAIGIARKQKARGMRKEARKTIGMCHGKFMERLKAKVESIKECELLIVKEDYTSQTCGRCGILHKVGIERVFICPNCGLDQDRDTNAARNILMRGLLLQK
uniref:Transposase n=1 Tax=viral metagenome TaxID=1070528 RepID=A0A6C0CC42_9ZZZZ